MYSSEIKVYIQNFDNLPAACGQHIGDDYIHDATTDPEIICDVMGHDVIIMRVCESAPCTFGVCSVGVLSDCNC
jgi:hypothetical protein